MAIFNSYVSLPEGTFMVEVFHIDSLLEGYTKPRDIRSIYTHLLWVIQIILVDNLWSLATFLTTWRV
jgi:hypothetical protein